MSYMQIPIFVHKNNVEQYFCYEYNRLRSSMNDRGNSIFQDVKFLIEIENKWFSKMTVSHLLLLRSRSCI
jgi:hypothetical protein